MTAKRVWGVLGMAALLGLATVYLVAQRSVEAPLADAAGVDAVEDQTAGLSTDSARGGVPSGDESDSLSETDSAVAPQTPIPVSDAGRAMWTDGRLDHFIEDWWDKAVAGDADARVYVGIALERCLGELRRREEIDIEQWEGADPCPDFDRAVARKYFDALPMLEATIEEGHPLARLWYKQQGGGALDRYARALADIAENRETIRLYQHVEGDRERQAADPDEVVALMNDAGPEGVLWGMLSLLRDDQLASDFEDAAAISALTSVCGSVSDCGPGTMVWEDICAGFSNLSCREDLSLEENLERALGPAYWRAYNESRLRVREMVEQGDYRGFLRDPSP